MDMDSVLPTIVSPPTGFGSAHSALGDTAATPIGDPSAPSNLDLDNFASKPTGRWTIRWFESCWSNGFTWDLCCSARWGPRGNQACWKAWPWTWARCCPLSPGTSNDEHLPYVHEPWLYVSTSPRLHGVLDTIRVYQGFAPVQLSRAEYQLLRWFECFADRSPSAWRGKRYVEFGAGVGAAALFAVLNGALVTFVAPTPSKWSIVRDNIVENLPEQYLSQLRFCEVDWRAGTLERAVNLLAACSADGFGHGNRTRHSKYDILVGILGGSGEGLGDDDAEENHRRGTESREDALDVRKLLALMHALSTPRSLTIIHGQSAEYSANAPFAHRAWNAALWRHFRVAGVWQDGGLTSSQADTLFQYWPRHSILSGGDDDHEPEPFGAAPSHWPRACGREPGRRIQNMAGLDAYHGRVNADLQQQVLSKRAVAACITGLERTLLFYPVVWSYHQRVMEPLRGGGYLVDSFASIIDTEGKPQLHREVFKAYQAAAVAVESPGVLRPACNAGRDELHGQNGRTLEQWHAIRTCYGLVESAERHRGRRYTWIYRLRSDTVYLEDLVPWNGLSQDAVFVPAGGMTGMPHFRCMNDHLFFCPRHLCRPYFHLLELWECSKCLSSPTPLEVGAPPTNNGSVGAGNCRSFENSNIFGGHCICRNLPDENLCFHIFGNVGAVECVSYQEFDHRCYGWSRNSGAPTSCPPGCAAQSGTGDVAMYVRDGEARVTSKMLGQLSPSVPQGLSGPPPVPYALRPIPQLTDNVSGAWQRWPITSQWYFFARYGGDQPCGESDLDASTCCGPLLREVAWRYSIARTSRYIECHHRLIQNWPERLREENAGFVEHCYQIQKSWKNADDW